MASANAHLERRRRTHHALAARLAALSDDDLGALLADTASWRANVHGNQSGLIEVDGVKVFVKKITLTDLELANHGSTANLFDLPTFYQYGVGSSGFGAWRELAAALKANSWALSGDCPHFPVVYQWRVLPKIPGPPPTDHQRAWLERAPAYWNGSDAVRGRLEAIGTASASIALFLEYVPHTLHAWLADQITGGRLDAGAEAAILRLHDQWRRAAAFVNDRGMLHFDLHDENLLTDGDQLYVADFGLALCGDFTLSRAERRFFEAHRLYDRAYVDWALHEWLAPTDEPRVLTPSLSALLDRRAPVATVFGAFIDTLINETKTAPYPAAELAAALAAQASGLAP